MLDRLPSRLMQAIKTFHCYKPRQNISTILSLHQNLFIVSSCFINPESWRETLVIQTALTSFTSPSSLIRHVLPVHKRFIRRIDHCHYFQQISIKLLLRLSVVFFLSSMDRLSGNQIQSSKRSRASPLPAYSKLRQTPIDGPFFPFQTP